ncbi:MAG: hypothetical protein JW740_00840 [Candidatus Zambryskibacteria bacterium]|nr:hypothetical protein [Candidatus Zambryskibacteria bacterium]
MKITGFLLFLFFRCYLTLVVLIIYILVIFTYGSLDLIENTAKRQNILEV